MWRTDINRFSKDNKSDWSSFVFSVSLSSFSTPTWNLLSSYQHGILSKKKRNYHLLSKRHCLLFSSISKSSSSSSSLLTEEKKKKKKNNQCQSEKLFCWSTHLFFIKRRKTHIDPTCLSVVSEARSRCRRFLNQLDTWVVVKPVASASSRFSRGDG